MLNKVANVITGIKPCQTEKGIPKQTKEIFKEKPFTDFEKHDSWYPLRGTQVRRYLVNRDNEYIDYGE